MGSQVINARLHPDNEKEGQALRIYNDLIDTGYTSRQIVTDALLRLDGITPEMFDTEPSWSGILAGIYDEIRDFKDQQLENFRKMLMEIRSADPETFKAIANAESDEEAASHVSPEFMENLRNAARPGLKREDS